jgi:hypothetical protein
MTLKTIIPQDMTQEELVYMLEKITNSEDEDYVQVSLANGRDYLLPTARIWDYMLQLNVES